MLCVRLSRSQGIRSGLAKGRMKYALVKRAEAFLLLVQLDTIARSCYNRCECPPLGDDCCKVKDARIY